MPWRSFATWNALGGISWATTIGLVAYIAGAQGKNFIASFGICGLLSSGVTLGAAVLWRRRHSDPGRAPSSPHPSRAQIEARRRVVARQRSAAGHGS